MNSTTDIWPLSVSPWWAETKRPRWSPPGSRDSFHPAPFRCDRQPFREYRFFPEAGLGQMFLNWQYIARFCVRYEVRQSTAKRCPTAVLVPPRALQAAQKLKADFWLLNSCSSDRPSITRRPLILTNSAPVVPSSLVPSAALSCTGPSRASATQIPPLRPWCSESTGHRPTFR